MDVSDLAKVIGYEVDLLLEAINQAGLSQLSPNDNISTEDRKKILEHIKSTKKGTKKIVMENIDPIINLLMIFILACIIGYYVIWGVTSALHSPLMAVTNAISSVIIVGALIAAGPEELNFSSIMGFFAIVLASVNIFGGFVVSHRMLSMFKKKDKKKENK